MISGWPTICQVPTFNYSNNWKHNVNPSGISPLASRQPRTGCKV